MFAQNISLSDTPTTAPEPTNPFTITCSDPNTLVNSMEFDFEEYAMEHGIPQTIDPLPYLRPASVFEDKQPEGQMVTSAKNDPRLRTVVCRHWLRGLCMKGNACEFLHQYDLQRMSVCQRGKKCKVPDCPFRHVNEDEQLECTFYAQGFCVHGPTCRYKHVPRDAAALPYVANFAMRPNNTDQQQHNLTTTSNHLNHNPLYKTALCRRYRQGSCSFGERCNFAHGPTELRPFAPH